MPLHERPWLKSYDPGVAPDIEIPDESVVDRFRQIASRYGHKPALHFYGITLTYKELDDQSDTFAHALLAHGCTRGDVVGINLPNIPQYVIAQLGVIKAGCAASGLSPLQTPRELAYQLNDCRARALVTLDAIFEHRLEGVADQIDSVRLVVVTGLLDFLPLVKRLLGRFLKKVPHGKVKKLPGKHVVAFTEIMRRDAGGRPDMTVGPDDHCLVQYTGGTTGLPKGTILTHRNLVANLDQFRTWLGLDEGAETFLSGFPFFHLAGLALAFAALLTGGSQVLIPNPRDTKHMVGEMATYHPTILVNVPSLYMMLLEEPAFRKLNFSGLSFCVSGASPFPAEAIRELEKVIGQGKVLEVYGMTEASPIITMNPRRGAKKIGTVGIPVPSTRARVMDLETGERDVALGEEGELVVSGPQVMKGYLNKPEDTAKTLRLHDGEQWLHTGDVVRMDADGFVTIVDRAKDMLNVGGFKVFSREVEEKLYEHPAIEFCAVIGVPNSRRPGTELVKLVVQPTAAYKDRDPEEVKEAILAFARENFSPYKVPKIIELVQRLPLTVVGKVDKKALR